jgi:hypothetical protein
MPGINREIEVPANYAFERPVIPLRALPQARKQCAPAAFVLPLKSAAQLKR